MNNLVKSMLVLTLLGSLGGCIPSQRQLLMERDLGEMKRRLAETERSMALQRQEQQGSVQDRLDDLGRRQADLLATIDALRVDMQNLSGRLEEKTQQGSGLQQDLALIRDDLGLKLGALEKRLDALEQKLSAQPAATAPPASPEALYERGLEMIQKQGDYARGREQLQDFLSRYPQSDKAANALYWIGEAYYGEKRYENAILQFQDVIQRYSDHPKAASAMLKQAFSFHALGDVKNAKVILKKLINTFPLAEEAQKAKVKLAEWG